MLPRLPLFLLLLFCLPVMAQRKDAPKTPDNKGAGGAPAMVAQEVKVVRGQSVVITLHGITSSNREITFKIADPPKLGSFKEAAPVPKGNKLDATITYTADPKGKGNKDTFTFEGQVPGSSVGDPATVTIHISDTAVKLDFVETLDAKRLLLGQPNERTFLLRNGGTARWQAKIEPPKGWQWIQPPDGAFDLGPGKEINARISCLALKVGPMQEVIEFAPGKKMTFVATVIPPFTLINSSVALDWQKQSRSRTGTVEINNLDTAKSLTIKLSGPAWLKTDPEMTLAADQRVPIALSSVSELGKSLSGKLKVSAGTYSEEVNVTAPPSPAVFSIRKGLDEKLGFHFGKLNAITMQSEKRPFTVTNDGGVPGTLKIKPPAPFRLEPPVPAEGIALAPGAEASFTMFPPTSILGTPRSELILEGGEDVVKAICSANIDPADIPPTPADLAGLYLSQNLKEIPRPTSTAEIMKAAVNSRTGIFFPTGKEDAKVPRVDVVDIVHDTGEEVTFGWDVPSGGPWKFQLMRATIQRYDGGKYAKVWEPCGKEVEYTINGTRATATVKELHPHMPFNFRIQTLSSDGKESYPGGPISYSPYPPDPSHWERYQQWYYAGMAILIALAWWMWKKWKEPISASA